MNKDSLGKLDRHQTAGRIEQLAESDVNSAAVSAVKKDTLGKLDIHQTAWIIKQLVDVNQAAVSVVKKDTGKLDIHQTVRKTGLFSK